MTSQITFGDDEITAEAVGYLYDLRGRLKQATNTPYDINDNAGTPVVTQYAYDPSGNRVGKTTGSSATSYLVDPMNPTGYSQVLQETTGSTVTSYILGSDVIGQAVGSADPEYLLYDGHGSVRNHADDEGEIIWFDIPNQAYNPSQPSNDTKMLSYDSWGQISNGLSGNGLYYAGEMFDPTLKMYNLRARWYNPANGRFNATDPYAGSPHDPQSLHKYLYCHGDPVNGVDPSGMWNFSETLSVAGIMTMITSISGYATMSSVSYHIGKDEDLIPDALAVNIGSAGAYKGYTGGITMTLIKEFRSGQWFYLVTGEGGLAPISVFKGHGGIGWLMTVGFIWNMQDPSQMSEIGFTATWPWTFARFALPPTLSKSRWAQIPLALARYNVGVAANRQGVVQFCQSTSGPAEIAGGIWSYSFGWTAGYSSNPRPIAGLSGDIADIVCKLIGSLDAITTTTPSSQAESQMKSALSFTSK